MKRPGITVLDGYTLSPGDISWQPLASMGELAVYEQSTSGEVIQRCKQAEIIFTNKVVIDNAVMEQLPQLKYIGVLATGYNVVDIAAAHQRGITVTNIPGYGTDSVAQFVFAQLLNWAQPVSYYDKTVKEKRWADSRDFCYYDHSMHELAGMVFGDIGYGAIGRRVAQLAAAFGMRVLVTTRTPPSDRDEHIDVVPLDTLIKNSDVISLHCPLSESNQGFVNADFLSQMKASAYLVNTSRGPLIEEQALFNALSNNTIAGAALDVLTHEPPDKNNPLYTQDNCTITPHIAWATKAARQRLMLIAADNLQQYFLGKPVNQL